MLEISKDISNIEVMSILANQAEAMSLFSKQRDMIMLNEEQLDKICNMITMISVFEEILKICTI